MRDEVQLIKNLGFNAARIHQKVEDPRFLYWADRLGLLVWGETAGAYEFSPAAVERLTEEWARIVVQYRSHPSIITWVPFNESWGLQHVAHDSSQQAYTLALVNLTRALDGSRPVISNDGWEHADSVIVTIHDYESSGKVLSERYSSEGLTRMMAGMGPAARRLRVGSLTPEQTLLDKPVMLTEFGGVSFAQDAASADSWGYSHATSSDDFAARLSALMDAVHGSPTLAGFCYTQLTDTRQEINGLCDETRQPKLPLQIIRELVVGASRQ